MMIETRINQDDSIAADDSISLADACKLLPRRRGKHPHLDTVRRWAAHGVSSRTGQTVFLNSFRMGGRTFTRLTWVREFITECTGGLESANGVDLPPTVSRSGEISEARRQLIAMGLHGAAAKAALLGTNIKTRPT
jgi:hypothetical protein